MKPLNTNEPHNKAKTPLIPHTSSIECKFKELSSNKPGKWFLYYILYTGIRNPVGSIRLKLRRFIKEKPSKNYTNIPRAGFARMRKWEKADIPLIGRYYRQEGEIIFGFSEQFRYTDSAWYKVGSSKGFAPHHSNYLYTSHLWRAWKASAQPI